MYISLFPHSRSIVTSHLSSTTDNTPNFEPKNIFSLTFFFRYYNYNKQKSINIKHDDEKIKLLNNPSHESYRSFELITGEMWDSSETGNRAT